MQDLNWLGYSGGGIRMNASNEMRQKSGRKTWISSLTITLLCLPLIYNQCSPAVFTKVSKEEAQVLDASPFVNPGGQSSSRPFNPNGSSIDDGLANPGDSFLPTENLRIDQESAIDSWVKNCGPEKYDKEKAEAIALAKENRNLIPVQYSISFGTAMDASAWFAHRRAILHSDDDGITPVVVAPSDSLDSADYEGSRAFHYLADHKTARKQFIKGERCYFSVIDVTDPKDNNPDLSKRMARSLNQPVKTDFHGECSEPDSACNNKPYNHSLQLMYYGDAYSTEEQKLMSPRLFKKLGPLARDENPQIIPLYVADFREPLFNIPKNQGPVIRPGFVSSATRRHEYAHCLRDILDMPLIYKHRWEVTWDLSKPTRNCKECSPCHAVKNQGLECYSKFDRLPGMEGVPQLLHNIFLASMDGVILPLQYTPIILDLGPRGIVTSSLEWGTFFNLNKQTVEIQRSKGVAGTFDPKDLLEPLKVAGPHLTAWLGGRLKNHQDVISYGTEFNSNWVRKAEDGFLVTLNENGKITSGQNLFGDHTTIDGERFGNGFLALRKFAKKKCESNNIEDRYVGPWDGELYSKTLKIWVDENRNGEAEKEEIRSLAESRVAAINTCYIEHSQAHDAYGNKTALRAAFLYMAAGEALTDKEIISRIELGKKSDGKPAEFRAAIDVFFKAMPNMTLLPKLLYVK
jgi:hypothetical protein